MHNIMSIAWSEQDSRSFVTARGETDDDEEEYSDNNQDDIGTAATTTSDGYRHNYGSYSCEHNNNHDNGHDNHHRQQYDKLRDDSHYDHEESTRAKEKPKIELEEENDNLLLTNKEGRTQQGENTHHDSATSSKTATTAMITTSATVPLRQEDTCNSITTPPMSPLPPPQSLSSPLWFGSSRYSSTSPCPPIPTSILRHDLISPNGSSSDYSMLNYPTGSNSMDHHLIMSPMASVSLAEDSTRTLPQHAIDLNLRIDQPPNTAWVYIHPRANTPSVRDLVHDLLLDHINPLYDGGGRIMAEYDLDGRMLAEYHHVIDRHYGLIAKYAMMNQVDILEMTTIMCEKEFQRGFGEDWSVVCREKRICSGREAMDILRCDARGLYEAWKTALVVRLGKDLYCGRIHSVRGKWFYVLNGFYMVMRNEYLEPSSCVHAYVIQWSAEMLPWEDFLTRAIGSSDPSKALPDSLRRIIYERYRQLEMEEQPNELFNAIHASESPLEGLAERMNWSFSKSLQQDEFGRLLLGKGIPESKILEWCENSRVSMSWDATSVGRDLAVSGMMDIFDIVKGMDTRECLDALIQVYDCELFGSNKSLEKKRKRRWRQKIVYQGRSGDNEASGGCCIIC
jgi:hypothetical protein